MSAITVKDGSTIYYKDSGKSPVVTFSGGWPLNSDAWYGQMLFLTQNGFRVVAHSGRGHGWSGQASSGTMFYGANQSGAKVSQGKFDQIWLWGMQPGLKNPYESIKGFSQTDFTEDHKRFNVPTLIMHGEDDQIVPIKDAAKKSPRLIRGAQEIYYPGAPHGVTATHQDQVNTDLLQFLRKVDKVSKAAYG